MGELGFRYNRAPGGLYAHIESSRELTGGVPENGCESHTLGTFKLTDPPGEPLGAATGR